MLEQQEKNYKKQRSRNCIIINEEKLINEVRQRPILYDRGLKGYRKASIRQRAWLQIASILKNPAEECKIRWRSLRDSFTRQCKLFINPDPNIPKRKKWLFYQQMEFLIPFIDAAQVLKDLYSEGNYNVNKLLYDDDSSDENSSNNNTNSDNNDNNNNSNITDDDNNHNKSSNVSEEYVETAKTEVLEIQPIVEDIKNSIEDEIIESSVENLEVESDEKFLLSCVSILRRLSRRKNSLARLKIQQILYQIEFEQ